MNIVLVEPEIPQNTGNIARTCAVTGSSLHLVRPLGFSIDDKYLKRAGLDYWHLLDINYYDNFNELRQKYSKNTFYYLTTKGTRFYTEVNYSLEDFLVFGKETGGLPGEIIRENSAYCMRIPMINDVRSLNLSNSAAIVIYEAWRQCGFPAGT
ncbi:tRNA (uridine(34)/cytosine(34)/5-carboxymethylaminomethyluridine(34)-2'-O)-methyltransferase TrmL [Phosphitispora fastidiosa]|uniref:tRNA (uridine(34)/cytosine(34)/5- carboxymethylaminomethyluridine(34)-2'-O)- methyltransferase TrmL n=1 Tax=Phosphitispora fastidiosa TaxID=2837202 RepID=UPI001E429CFA|nr:tRNA (uridine(34)/cytosine(34)/5-carboxymethylaminomethyluridine(34)-2'-O)-methyltransferase TrmL [Phosphitispora fastidiosa]MBU7008142.1 tRNA (cytidine/uridine-2'-O-)-methyltransferase [Phosphitispora fastidiosa]